MEETLGKRIVAHRKRIGITQDRLAEQLGVTAQAVSKWENDQSCPDITMLPKLAEIFGISVDALLGVVPPEPVMEAEVVEKFENDDQENEGLHFQNGNLEFRWDGGRMSRIWLAVWVLLMGGLMLLNLIRNREIVMWDMVWPSALMIFGISGLYPKLSFFRLGCALFGGYSLLENMQITGLGLSGRLLLIIAVLLFGLSLLADALRKPGKPGFSVIHNGKNIRHKVAEYNLGDDCFNCSVAFCEDHRTIVLPRLCRGSTDVSFGELTLDLTGCEEFAAGCCMDADCSFGELVILVPKTCRAEVNSSSAFGSVEVKGCHDAAPVGQININADVSFGQITVKYI